MRSRRCFVALAVVLAVAAVALAVPPPPSEAVAAFDAGEVHPVVGAVADPPRSIDELRERVGRVLAREHVPGVAIALVGSDGPMWIGGVGVADETTRAPVTADTVFRAASRRARERRRTSWRVPVGATRAASVVPHLDKCAPRAISRSMRDAGSTVATQKLRSTRFRRRFCAS